MIIFILLEIKGIDIHSATRFKRDNLNKGNVTVNMWKIVV